MLHLGMTFASGARCVSRHLVLARESSVSRLETDCSSILDDYKRIGAGWRSSQTVSTVAFVQEQIRRANRLPRLTIVAPAKEGPDLVVVSEERNEKLGASVLKDESQIAVTPAFEKLASELADTQTAVHVGLTKHIDQIAKSKETFYPFVLWQFTQTADDRGVDRK